MTEEWNNEAEGWEAKWISRPVQDHRDWRRYEFTADVSIESGGAALLFAVKDDRNHYGFELNADTLAVVLYAVEAGHRRAIAEGNLPGTAPLDSMAASIRLTAGQAALRVDGERVLAAPLPEDEAYGTIGFATSPGQRAVFRDARVCDEEGRSLCVHRFYDPDPAVMTFTAGRIDPSGSGLRLEDNSVSVCTGTVPVDSPLFRKTFQVPPIGLAGATLRVYALGWYEVSVNGRRPDDRVLAPANTPYGKRLLYDTYDVTALLQQGDNAIGLWLGNGYNHNYSRWGWKWKRDKAAILQLDIELSDGSLQRVITDESWLTADSAILANDIYDGEVFDARRLLPGWDQPDFDASMWGHALLAEPPTGELQANRQPPVRAFEPMAPVRLVYASPTKAVYDFGQNIAGWAKIQVEGAAGQRVTLRYSELVDAAGQIDPWTNRNARATDVYILSGGGNERYEPRFTYHGFRYIEVTAPSEVLAQLSIQAVPIHSDVREAGRFRSSSELLNRIQSNLRWSYLNNLVSIPTDCCQRDERTPCLMDSAVVEEAGMHNFDMRDYYLKWLGDIEGSDTNPDWSGDQITLPWHLYQHYGDEQVLRRYYPSMKAYVDHLTAKWPDSIVKEGFGDWCVPNTDGWESYFHEVEIVNTALYYRHAGIIAAAAEILGQPEDQRRYAQLADTVRQAFLRRFSDGYGIIGSGSQTAQLMPLAYGLVPEDQLEGAVARLVQGIRGKGCHLDTGIYGTRYLMDVLADHGHTDLAFELLSRTSYPSFGYQIEQGATTLWEQWSFKGGMHSHDHAMFGGIGVSFYTRLAGIRPLAPGYGRILIQPHIPSGLEWVEASLDTVRGRIVSSWRKQSDGLHIELQIPEGTAAEWVVPGKRKLTAAVRDELGPGTHRFVVPLDGR